MCKAIDKDIRKDYLGAVAQYEIEIKDSEHSSVENFANLAFLYWAFAAEQIEFNQPNNIPDQWSEIGGNRFSVILDKGLNKHPNSLELNFWKLYFPYRLFMFNLSENDCIDLLRQYQDDITLVPYFFLSLFDKEKYRNEIERLRETCNNNPTAKNIYIRSFISI